MKSNSLYCNKSPITLDSAVCISLLNLWLEKKHVGVKVNAQQTDGVLIFTLLLFVHFKIKAAKVKLSDAI